MAAAFGRHRGAKALGRGALLGAALVLVLPATPLAAQPPAKRPEVHDVEVTVRARSALQRDEVLAPLGLVVRARSGVATVSGAVPSREVADRAVAALRKVRGVYEVRSQLRVVLPPEALLHGLLRALARGPAPDLSPLLSSAEDDPGTGLPPAFCWPREEQPEERFSARRDLPAPEREEGAAVSLGPPVAVAAPPRPAPARTVGQSSATSELSRAVESLRAGDPGLEHLSIEIVDGVVTVRGRADGAGPLMRLARAISVLPGVRAVDVSAARTSP